MLQYALKKTYLSVLFSALITQFKEALRLIDLALDTRTLSSFFEATKGATNVGSFHFPIPFSALSLESSRISAIALCFSVIWPLVGYICRANTARALVEKAALLLLYTRSAVTHSLTQRE
jgi:hypothetical protein